MIAVEGIQDPATEEQIVDCLQGFGVAGVEGERQEGRCSSCRQDDGYSGTMLSQGGVLYMRGDILSSHNHTVARIAKGER